MISDTPNVIQRKKERQIDRQTDKQRGDRRRWTDKEQYTNHEVSVS